MLLPFLKHDSDWMAGHIGQVSLNVVRQAHTTVSKNPARLDVEPPAISVCILCL